MGLALMGWAIGLVGAFAMARFVSSLRYGVRSTDPATFASGFTPARCCCFLVLLHPCRHARRSYDRVEIRIVPRFSD